MHGPQTDRKSSRGSQSLLPPPALQSPSSGILSAELTWGQKCGLENPSPYITKLRMEGPFGTERQLLHERSWSALFVYLAWIGTLYTNLGETVETMADFIFLGSKITADGDCSYEIKRRLLLGRKVMTNLDSIFKSRHITLPTKVHLVKAVVFPVVMFGCESWTVKKAERQRIDAFELWCWRRLLRVPWTAKRSNQSILKEISPGCSLEGMMLKLKLQYFGYLMRRVDSLEKTQLRCWEGLGAGGEEDDRG